MNRIITIFDISGWNRSNLLIKGPMLQIALKKISKHLLDECSETFCLKIVDLKLPLCHMKKIKSKAIESTKTKKNNLLQGFSHTPEKIYFRPEHLPSGAMKFVSGDSYEHEWLMYYINQTEILTKTSHLNCGPHLYFAKNEFQNNIWKCKRALSSENTIETLLSNIIKNLSKSRKKQIIILFLDLPQTIDCIDSFKEDYKSISKRNHNNTQLVGCFKRLCKCFRLIAKNKLQLLLVDTNLKPSISEEEAFFSDTLIESMTVSRKNNSKWRPQIVRLSSLIIPDPLKPFNMNFEELYDLTHLRNKKFILSSLIFGQEAGISRVIIGFCEQELAKKHSMIKMIKGKGKEVFQIQLYLYGKNNNLSTKPNFHVLGILNFCSKGSTFIERCICIGEISLNCSGSFFSPRNKQTSWRFRRLLFNLAKNATPGKERGLLVINLQCGRRYILAPDSLGRIFFLWQIEDDYHIQKFDYCDTSILLKDTTLNNLDNTVIITPSIKPVEIEIASSINIKFSLGTELREISMKTNSYDNKKQNKVSQVQTNSSILNLNSLKSQIKTVSFLSKSFSIEFRKRKRFSLESNKMFDEKTFINDEFCHFMLLCFHLCEKTEETGKYFSNSHLSNNKSILNLIHCKLNVLKNNLRKTWKLMIDRIFFDLSKIFVQNFLSSLIIATVKPPNISNLWEDLIMLCRIKLIESKHDLRNLVCDATIIKIHKPIIIQFIIFIEIFSWSVNIFNRIHSLQEVFLADILSNLFAFLNQHITIRNYFLVVLLSHINCKYGSQLHLSKLLNIWINKQDFKFLLSK